MIDQYLKPNVKQGAIYAAIIVAVLGILLRVPLLGCLVLPFACVAGLVVPLAVGYLTAQWGKTMPATMTPLAVQSTSPYATPAVDGAVAAAVGALVGGLIAWIVDLLFGGIFATIGAATNSDAAGALAFGLAASGIGGIFGVIFSTIFAAVLGAIGGVLYVAVGPGKTSTPTLPTPPNPSA
jgi:hypothetical protein